MAHSNKFLARHAKGKGKAREGKDKGGCKDKGGGKGHSSWQEAHHAIQWPEL